MNGNKGKKNVLSIWIVLFLFLLLRPVLAAASSNHLMAAQQNQLEGVAGICDSVFNVVGDTTSFALDPHSIYVIADYEPKYTRDAACLDVAQAGFYQIIATVLNDTDQVNESFFLTVRYEDGTINTPCDANLLPYKVVQDSATVDSVVIRKAGIFYLRQGRNVIVLNHYAKIAVQQPDLWIGPADSASVHSNPQSVHFKKMTLIATHETRDLALSYSAQTDTSIEVNGKIVQANRKGETYQLTLTVQNVATGTLWNVAVWATVPDSTTFSAFSLQPSDTVGDTLFWMIPFIPAGGSENISFETTITSQLPFTPFPLPSDAGVEAHCDTILSNNFDSTRVYAYDPCSYFTPEDPMIQANPGEIYNGDRVQVKVRLPRGVVVWDVWARFADGSVDSSWADGFIAQTGNAADQWLQIQPKFTDTQLRTQNNQEPLIFEVRSRDKCGNFKTAQAQVTLKRYIPHYDLSLGYQAQTDTSVEYQGNQVPAVFEGDVYDSRVQISNTGPDTAKGVWVWVTQPDSARFLTPTLPPTRVSEDTLFWYFAVIAPGQQVVIPFRGKVSDTLPMTPVRLFSGAQVVAPSDTNAADNADSTVIYAFNRCVFFTPEDPAIQASPSWIYNGDTVAVQVRLPKNVVWWDVWARFADGSVDSTWADGFITQTGNVADQWLQIQPKFTDTQLRTQNNQEPLVFEVRSRDKCGHFKMAQAQVVLRRYIPHYDLRMGYEAQTDTTVEYGGQQVPAVFEGDVYDTKVQVSNTGPDTARGVWIWVTVPDSVRFLTPTLPPTRVSGDTLFWYFGEIPPGQTVEIPFQGQVSDELPLTPVRLFSQAQVVAGADTNETDNSDSTLIWAFSPCAFFSPENPDIQVSPSVVEVGDSVTVRVKLPKGVIRWDVWISYIDGTVDTTFADAFIAQGGFPADQWIELHPKFTNTKLITSAESEAIQFQIHTIDRCGNSKIATAQLLVHSSNDCMLDRNVFRPGSGTPLGIKFKLSSNRVARIDLYDITGYHIMKITEGPYSAGWNTYRWNGLLPDGKKVGSGVYIITINSGVLHCWKKVILVR